MINLTNKLTTYSISSTEGDFGFEGSVEVSATGVTKVNGTIIEGTSPVGNLNYYIDSEKITKNLSNVSIARESAINEYVSILVPAIQAELNK